MNTRRSFILLVVLIGIVAMMPGPALARVHFSIGLGTAIGWGHPHRAWCTDWYWHRYPHAGWPWYGYPHRPWCSPTVGVWVGHWPSVVVETPAVVTERHVVVENPVSDCPAPAVQNTGAASEAARRKQGELLKILRIGDAEDRVRSAQELGGYLCDVRVSSALERALLSDRDAQVRQTAAESLAKLGDAKALPTLKQAQARDPVREVRQAAYKAIIMIEGY